MRSRLSSAIDRGFLLAAGFFVPTTAAAIYMGDDRPIIGVRQIVESGTAFSVGFVWEFVPDMLASVWSAIAGAFLAMFVLLQCAAFCAGLFAWLALVYIFPIDFFVGTVSHAIRDFGFFGLVISPFALIFLAVGSGMCSVVAWPFVTIGNMVGKIGHFFFEGRYPRALA